jgi:glycosyltransferase involved in cell wall biosynthesis
LDATLAEPKLDFVFVDDGSTDDTARVISELCVRGNGRMELLALERNRGKAEAVRRGVVFAFDRSPPPELIGYWDADLATPLHHVAKFAALFADPQIQMVLGSRVQMLGRHIARSPLRHYLGRLFASTVSVSLGIPIYDSQCGAKMFRANAVFRSVFSVPFRGNWTFDVELFERLLHRQAATHDINVIEQCVEFPLTDWHDAPGSKIGWRHIPQIIFETSRIAAVRTERNRHQ